MLYVPQGFEAIDRGVAAALEQTVQLTVVDPTLLHATAEQLRPDAVLVMNGLHTFPANHLEQIDAVRRLGILTAIWFVDDPYVSGDTAIIAPRYDVVFTHERSCVPHYRALGCKEVYHLPLAAHQELFRPMAVPEAYRTDVCFIGVAFWNRVKLFDHIAPYLKNKKVLLAGSLWNRMERFSDVSAYVRDGWIEVPETVKYYNGAKIVINVHRTPEPLSDNKNTHGWGAESVNPRTFEIASCGTLQLTDQRPELPDHYDVNSEVISFRTAEELMDRIEYYLRHEEERLWVAARSYKRTRAQHTFLHRVGYLLDVLQQPRP